MADFSDLNARVLSAAAMIVVGAGAIWAGGLVFAVLAILVSGLMGWELYRMMVPEAPQGRAEAHGVAAAVLVGVFSFTWGGFFSVSGLLLGAILVALKLPRDRWVFGAYFLLICLAGHGLIMLREAGETGIGAAIILWLIVVVIASDTAGYFAGRLLGGPKFWPKVSPKKTWSGTVAGWVLAAAVGWAFMGPLGAGVGLVVASVFLALAGQMGDIAESAIKRRYGVKDSSDLIPGHGGVLDRFDALIAVVALAYLMALFGLGGLIGAA